MSYTYLSAKEISAAFNEIFVRNSLNLWLRWTIFVNWKNKFWRGSNCELRRRVSTKVYSEDKLICKNKIHILSVAFFVTTRRAKMLADNPHFTVGGKNCSHYLLSYCEIFVTLIPPQQPFIYRFLSANKKQSKNRLILIENFSPFYFYFIFLYRRSKYEYEFSTEITDHHRWV